MGLVLGPGEACLHLLRWTFLYYYYFHLCSIYGACVSVQRKRGASSVTLVVIAIGYWLYLCSISIALFNNRSNNDCPYPFHRIPCSLTTASRPTFAAYQRDGPHRSCTPSTTCPSSVSVRAVRVNGIYYSFELDGPTCTPGAPVTCMCGIRRLGSNRKWRRDLSWCLYSTLRSVSLAGRQEADEQYETT